MAKHVLKIEFDQAKDPLAPLKVSTDPQEPSQLVGDTLRVSCGHELEFTCKEKFSILFPNEDVVKPGKGSLGAAGVSFDSKEDTATGQYKVEIPLADKSETIVTQQSYEYYIALEKDSQIFVKDPDVYVDNC